jgi:hypothetical protein
MGDTILTSTDGFCVSQTTTTVDTSWVTPEMMQKWAKESEDRIAARQKREADQDELR